VFSAFNPNMTWENVQLIVNIFTFTVINCAWVAFFASEPIHINAALASRGPFLESPGNFSGPKSNIQTEI